MLRVQSESFTISHEVNLFQLKCYKIGISWMNSLHFALTKTSVKLNEMLPTKLTNCMKYLYNIDELAAF